MDNNLVEISKGVYWVGVYIQTRGLQCNPYLIVDEDEAVLIDPGSVLDFEYVLENVLKIVSLDKIKHIILHHQDPDFCASVPLFEKAGGQFKIITHWRTQTLLKYYGIKSQYYSVNSNGYKFTFKSGRELKFIPTPYLHFPGSIATYDSKSKILFSSDLFGAFSDEWELYADEKYVDRMKTYHEHYMPSNDILRPVMEQFLNLDISQIAPQHGSIINKDIPMYIECLKDLECGTFLNPVRKNLMQEGGYTSIFNRIIKRYSNIFSEKEVKEIISTLNITVDYSVMEIVDYAYTGVELWELFFQTVYEKKGYEWLNIVEPFIITIAKTFDLQMPKIFTNLVKHVGEENEKLKQNINRLNQSILETQNKLIRCPVTNLYNYDFFRQYLSNEVKNNNKDSYLIIANIDKMTEIKLLHGDSAVEEILKSIAYIIKDICDEDKVLFRLQGAYFACYMPNADKEKALCFAEKFRTTVEISDSMIEKISLSIGVSGLDEVTSNVNIADEWYNLTMNRVTIAKNSGMNIVCHTSLGEETLYYSSKILIIDNDSSVADVLKTFLVKNNYNVFIASDGDEALSIVEKEQPTLIISEIMLPKINGFLVRENLLLQSNTKNIPFIVISHNKNEDTVQRAISLKIENFFKKPFMISELIGVVNNKLKGDNL